MSKKDLIDIKRLPKHIAIIMDGNGRWAKQFGKMRIFGHQNGVKAVREASESAAELGVEFLTLYAFSTENWNRPKKEVDALMKLLVETIDKEVPTLNKNDIKLQAIGNIKSLPENSYKQLNKAIEETKNNKRMTLNLALSYSSRWELTDAIQEIAMKVKKGEIQPENINQDLISSHLETANMPDPELLIRTSGEYRISNFLLWQIAYAELYFTDKLWPDFRKEDLYEAILDFQNRERRFGKTSEQILNA
ncbi:MAG: isoprenyl transferase [Bacteroidetes bacterium]|nr:isoprenyl transferase [Bacteroidota bacterium]|tara:strand:- start:162 stop:908 length:747 start_codon:yes stop_codon:yes gene_type:complete